MDKSYFIYTSQGENLCIERFHICTWEFSNGGSLVEFGIEIRSDSILQKDNLSLILFAPWLKEDDIIKDFYSKLKDSTNSRFIFNDAIKNTTYIDEEGDQNGVIHEFSTKGKLCVLPIQLPGSSSNKKIPISVELNFYNQFLNNARSDVPNIYFRFCITPKISLIYEEKKGITKSTILYDIRVNQRRNIPNDIYNEILQHELCAINFCFCFNIIPNNHDLSFFDSRTLKNVRTLEFDSFSKYLGNEGLKEKDLLVVFNKDECLDSYTFFAIYTKEHIGVDQLAVALIINLVAGVLLFLASFNYDPFNKKYPFKIKQLPPAFWIVIVIFLLMVLYFIERRFRLSSKIKRLF